MKGVIEIPEKKFKKEFDNLKVTQYRIMRTVSTPTIESFTEVGPVGKPIVLITSDMPADLRKTISNIISTYCNH